MAYVRMHPKFQKFRMKVGVMPDFYVTPDFAGSKIIDQEVPQGVMDGSNKVFTLAQVPIENTDQVFKDGMKMKRAASSSFVDGEYIIVDGDYLLDYVTGILRFSPTQIPQSASIILVSYKYL